MKTTNGSFGSGTQESNSLVSAMLKHPEISSVLIQQYPRYALTYLLERTGRHASVKIMGDKSFEWKVLGRTSQKVTTIAQTVIDLSATAAEIEFAVDIKYFAVNDVIMDAAGNVGQVTAVAATAGVVNGADAAGFGVTANFAQGHAAVAAAGSEVFGLIGSSFKEGSLGSEVVARTAYPETHKNWLTINRSKISITGSALTDVTWIENNGSKLWYFTAERLFTDEFMYQLELQRWFGKANVLSASADDYPGDGGANPLSSNASPAAVGTMGDGILAQIDGTNTGTYALSTGLTEDNLARFIAELSRNAKSPEGNEWVVFTGTEGRYQFHKAMKDITVGATNATGGTMQSMKTGSDVALGVNYVSYNVLGNKMTVAYCPVFDDVNVHGATAAGGTGGSMSGKMVFLDFSSVDGVPNIQLVAKGADGFNRNYIKKYIPGMVSPYDQKGMLAANGDDSFTCQIMSESGVIVRNPLSCGILSATPA
tara:strand:- start:4512 stop:5957 length:1446 start_codon:yes stop_codon:yes gene_type:complete